MVRFAFTCLLLITASVLGAGKAEAQFQPRPQGSRSPVQDGRLNNQFGSRSHVDQLAAQLYRESNDICWEMHRHYRDNRGFTSVYRDIYTIKETAKKLDFLVRGHRSVHPRIDDRIAHELYVLDQQFHDFKADVRNWRPDSYYIPRTALHIEIAECEQTLHHLMDDYGVKSRHTGSDHDHARGPKRNGSPIGNRPPGFPRR
ncbi:MAG: hypothetical protein O2955_07265 [Planctomycetota bacterium]|nr:hypothetical protein [Planctomycetota bacterium]MDA1212297.1 hypothetical protein [Planctomycetota bacterium]